MQNRGAANKSFYWTVFVILIAVVAVSYLQPGSTGELVRKNREIPVPNPSLYERNEFPGVLQQQSPQEPYKPRITCPGDRECVASTEFSSGQKTTQSEAYNAVIAACNSGKNSNLQNRQSELEECVSKEVQRCTKELSCEAKVDPPTSNSNCNAKYTVGCTETTIVSGPTGSKIVCSSLVGSTGNILKEPAPHCEIERNYGASEPEHYWECKTSVSINQEVHCSEPIISWW